MEVKAVVPRTGGYIVLVALAVFVALFLVRHVGVVSVVECAVAWCPHVQQHQQRRHSEREGFYINRQGQQYRRCLCKVRRRIMTGWSAVVLQQ